MGKGVNDRGLSAYHVKRATHDCLKRLQTDHIDILQMHHLDRGTRSISELGNIGLTKEIDLCGDRFDTPWEEIAEAFGLLRAQGLITYFIFSLATAFNVRTEEHTAAGRTDFVLETKDAVYVFEFKLHGSSEEALQQIEDKGYAIPYENGPKKLYKIGACFDEELRTLKDWIVVGCPDTTLSSPSF